MTEIGRIVKIEEDIAVVRFFRKSECDRCRICATAKDAAHSELKVENSLKLNEGDCVSVEIYRKRIFTASVLIYLLPLALTALGAGLGSLAGTAASILLGIAGIVVGLAFAVPVDICVLRKKEGYKPKMIEACREIDYFNARPNIDEN